MADLDRFELFTYVAQAPSLTQAAKKLGMTKASLSKQIRQLEASLKIDLFTRQGQRLKITDQGSLLLEQCLRLKKELDDARAICQQLHEEPAGRLHIVTFKCFANQLIYPKLKDFLKRYPKLELFIDTNERMPDFEREQIDLGIGYTLPAPLDIVRRSFMKTRFVLCGSQQYFAENGIPKKLEDLQKHYYLGHTGRPENYAIKLNPKYKCHVTPYLFLNDHQSIIECAKLGLGLGQMAYYMAEPYLKSGELIEVLPEFQMCDAEVYYYYPKYRYVQPKVRKFIDYFFGCHT